MSSDAKLISAPERLWHAVHLLTVVILTLTGFNLHYSQDFNIFGSFDMALKVHIVSAVIFILDFVLWFFYQIASKRIGFYFPNKEDVPVGLIKQALYYGFGIFFNHPHPFPADGIKRKFNPLQKFAYAGVMGGLVPLLAITGIVLIAYIYFWDGVTDPIRNIAAYLHTILAYFISAFIVGHVYLATTGSTPLAYFKTIITGKHYH